MSACSLVLDFDDPGEAPPPADAFHSDASEACLANEPNDELGQATALSDGSLEPLAICPAGDHDFFHFTITDGQDVVVRATFDNQGGQGDLEMRLNDADGQRVDSSETWEDFERIERSDAESNQLAAGTYYVEMYGFNDTTEADYVLHLCTVAPCDI